MKRMVIRLVAMSLKSGRLAVAEFRNHRIKALVRAENGHEAYLAIIAEGVPDPQLFALLLDCVDLQLEHPDLARIQGPPRELRGHRLVHDEPVRRRAGLAHVAQLGEHRALDRRVEVDEGDGDYVSLLDPIRTVTPSCDDEPVSGDIPGRWPGLLFMFLGSC